VRALDHLLGEFLRADRGRKTIRMATTARGTAKKALAEPTIDE
jgi:hypothetical protein